MTATQTPIETSMAKLQPAIRAAARRFGKDMQVSALPVGARTANALEHANITTIEELKEMTADTKGLGVIGLHELRDALWRISNEPSPITIDRIISDLIPSEYLEILSDYFGLIKERRTLETIAKERSLTRERIRQLKAKALNHLKKLIISGLDETDILMKIADYAAAITPINDIQGLTSQYNLIGLVKLFVEMSSPTFEILDGGMFREKLLIVADDKKKLMSKAQRIMDCLEYQEGFVDIKELYTELKIKHNIAPYLNDVVVENGLIASTSNDNIFENKKHAYVEIRKFLIKMDNPQTIEQIASALGYDEHRVRTAVLTHKDIFARVGPSKYALKEQSYLGGTTASIAEHFLKEANRPLAMTQIKKLVKRHLEVSDNTIQMKVSADPRFQRVSDTEYALKSWGYEDWHKPGRDYPVAIKDAIYEVFKIRRDTGLSTSEVAERIKKLYQDDATHNRSTVGAFLEKLTQEKFLIKKRYGKCNYYFKK